MTFRPAAFSPELTSCSAYCPAAELSVRTAAVLPSGLGDAKPCFTALPHMFVVSPLAAMQPEYPKPNPLPQKLDDNAQPKYGICEFTNSLAPAMSDATAGTTAKMSVAAIFSTAALLLSGVPPSSVTPWKVIVRPFTPPAALARSNRALAPTAASP